MLRKIFQNSLRVKYNKTSIRLSTSDSDRNALNQYHALADETLEELNEKLEMLLEDRYESGADVSLSSGVLTVVVDSKNTYVINKQTPNRQIWMSSPLTGPIRFDLKDGKWIDRHSNKELSSHLKEELGQLLKKTDD